MSPNTRESLRQIVIEYRAFACRSQRSGHRRSDSYFPKDHVSWRGAKMPPVQPNQYVLKGGSITVTYTTSNFLGQPFLSYNDGTTTKDFFGSAIRVVDVGIGTLVTVTTHMTIDTGGTEFSVLLPAIQLADANKTQQFNTDGVITTFKGPE